MEMGILVKAVFDKQKELMEKYEVIEHENGFTVPSSIPIDLNDKFDQARLKDFAWRITEELAEVIEQTRADQVNISDVHEELADVLHFMAEQVILAGMEKEIIHLVERNMHWAAIKIPEQRPSDAENSRYYGELTYHMAMACHKLKNKPWKQSHRETDKHAFKNHILDFWRSYMFFCHVNGLPLDGLFIEYHKKHAINKTRQDTGY